MANSRTLQILLKLRDDASKQLQTFGSRLEQNQANFKKMAAIGTAGLAGIGAGVGVAVKAASDAEVAWTKFDVVFGDSADDMREFIKDVRQDIPLAERVIGKMTAGLGDMLVPMGFARNEAAEMSKQFVGVSAGVAAFNNVDPSEVLNAIQSGLSGSGEALRRFGINADLGRLEMLAMEMGLLDAEQSFAKLDSETRRYIQAQALVEAVTRDSADAVAGLEKEKGTLAFKMRDLSASTQELRETIGSAFIPIVTSLVEKITPLIEKIAKFAEENPKLVLTLTLVTAGLFGLLTVVGLLGLALPAIITGFGFITAKVLIVGGAIAILIAVGVLLVKNWDKIKAFASKVWEGIKNAVSSAVEAIIQFVTNMYDQVASALTKFWEKWRKTIIVIVSVITGLFLPRMVVAVVKTIKSLAVMTASTVKNFAVQTAQWVAMSAKAVANSIIISIKAIPTVIAGLAKMTWAMITTSIGFIAKWVLMGVQSLIHAGKVALAWIIAMGPIAWVIAIIAGLVAFIILNWEKVKEITERIWGGISEWLVTFFENMKLGIQEVGDFFKNIWQSVSEFFQNILQNIAIFFKNHWQVMLGILTLGLSAQILFLIKNFDKIKEIFTNVWNGIKDFFSNTWDAIVSIGEKAIEKVKNFLDPIVDMINKVIDGLERIGQGVGGRIKNLFSRKEGRERSVNDAIISPRGDIITTHPDDYIIATKTPETLGAGGGGVTIQINTMVGEEEFARKMGDNIMKELQHHLKFSV